MFGSTREGQRSNRLGEQKTFYCGHKFALIVKKIAIWGCNVGKV